MKIEDLSLFLNVCQSGSFAAAAKNVQADPSSVSRQIAALEQEVGFKLFERSTRRLALTEAGRIVEARLRAPLEEISDIFALASDAVVKPRGRVRLSASVTFGERWLAPRLRDFRESHPDIELDLVLTDDQLDLVVEEIDLAIRLGERLDGDYVSTRLMPTRYRGVASPEYLSQRGHPETLSDLGQHDCLCFSLPGYKPLWRFRTASGQTAETAVQPAMSMTNALVMRRAALDGAGIAVLADWTIDEDIKAGRLVDVFEGTEVTATGFDTAAWLIYPSRSYVPAKTRALINFLKSRV